MLLTEKELQISNKSYTNKDFEAIYTELLDYAVKLSGRMDFTDSNESDPFILLLKLVAFVTDKVNYNVDKNILERFILSCTQEKSMRELCDMMGYHIPYYMSAKTPVYFKYKFSGEEENDIIIPKFSTINNGDNIQYTLLAEAIIDKDTGYSTEQEAIQGKIKKLTVLDSDIIQLENLDDNKLYLPEKMVAENGIIIEAINDPDERWQKVNNLNIQEQKAFVYTFGYDSKKGLPYIQFPNWITEIIGEGLHIWYVVTDGVLGNVSARSLVNVARNMTESDGISDDKIQVINYSAASSGTDPETIDKSYKGFKKIVGTFDTLVTCRDYANKIYNLIDERYDAPYVSNIQVGDRRNDINYGCNVVTFNEDGITSLCEPVGDIRSSDIILYGLKPINNYNYTAYKDKEGGYNDSYDYLSNYSNIRKDIEDYKTISHTYKTLNSNDIITIRDYYVLNAIVNTIEKVDILEQQEILTNIYTALIKNYNAREVEFGYEIPFDELLKTMEEADPRIKAISLQEPEHNLVKYSKNGESPLFNPETKEPNNWFKMIVSKNVLSGKISLFNYLDDFTYEYIYKDAIQEDDIQYVSTYCNFPEIPGKQNDIPGELNLTLKNNENIQLIAPALTTEQIYPYGINYYLQLKGKDYIPENSEYKLQADEQAIFLWTNNSDQRVCAVYTSGDILRPNFNFYTTKARSADKQTPTLKAETVTVENGYPAEQGGICLNKDYFTLSTKQEVEHRTLNKNVINSHKKCYWLTKNENNNILWEETGNGTGIYQYLLKEDEYFFYSDISLTSLFAYGSGTTLECNNDTRTMFDPQGKWINTQTIEITKIEEQGLDALKEYFQPCPFENTKYLNIITNEIITLTEGSKIKFTNNDTTPYTIYNNDFRMLPSGINISYQYEGDEEEGIIAGRETLSDENKWKIRSLLDINAGPDNIQILENDQEIVFKKESEEITLSRGNCFKFNYDVQENGGEDISLKYLDLDLTYKYPKILTFETDASVNVNQGQGNLKDMSVIEFENGQGKTSSAHINLPILEQSNDNYKLIMFYLNNLNEGDKVNLSASDGDISFFNVTSDTASNTSGLDLTENDKLYIVKLDSSVSQLTIRAEWAATSTGDKITVALSKVKLIKGINPLLGLKNTTLDQIINYIKGNYPTQFEKCYICADIDNSKHIEVSGDYHLSSYIAFYDYNNIVNKWVLPKIDFENSKITIARSSKK